ncbi:HIR complex subunit [Massospora cicadina]|nr:HIR complex subunit [Massospora cicadina]
MRLIKDTNVRHETGVLTVPVGAADPFGQGVLRFVPAVHPARWLIRAQKRLGGEQAICSIDFHPKGTRIATGGYDCKIYIWDALPILNKAKATERLAVLPNHSGSVNCVRWSRGDGEYLASGSDDKLVLIWELDPLVLHLAQLTFRASKAPVMFGEAKGGPNVENWKISRRLVGHTLDIMDIAWSYDNAYLATCGMDSKIVIWRNFESYRVLELATPVKGISFDPRGEFLASQSDDQKVIVWNTSTWQQHRMHDFQTVKKLGTFFQRLSWSPDGEHLATANVMSGSSPVSYLLDRATFTPKTMLVGHTKGIEASLFNPRIFTRGDPTKPILYIALGTQDNSISLWSTSATRPLSAIETAFCGSIKDLSWSADGYVLGACSADGAAIFIHFFEEDLGTARDLNLTAPTGKRLQTIAASAQQLQLESAARPAIPQSEVSAAPVVPTAQKVATVNGRKRITPINFGVGDAARAASTNTSLADLQPAALAPNPPKPAPRARDELTAFQIRDSPLPAAKKPCHEVRRRIPCPPFTPYLGQRHVAFARPTVLRRLVRANVGARALVVECDNTPRTSIKYCVLTCAEGEVELWRDILSSPATIIECHTRFIAVACENGDLLTYTMVGSKVLPILRIDAQVAFLCARDHLLLCISASGLLYLWYVTRSALMDRDLEEKRSVVAAVSVAPLIDATQPPPVISSACIVHGRALVSLDNGRSYVFDPAVMAWVLARSPLLSLSEFQPSPEDVEADVVAPFTQAPPDGLDKLLLQSPAIDHPTQRVISLSQLEHQVAAAQVLRVPDRYRAGLLKLVYRLTDEGMEAKLREICQSVLGPLVPSPEPAGLLVRRLSPRKLNFQPQGLDRPKLLDELLRIMAANRALQHVVSEYRQALADLHPPTSADLPTLLRTSGGCTLKIDDSL